MNETYCGKSCQACTYRADTGCRGCREEGSRECKLAHCCREKGHETCGSCTYNIQCGMYQGKDTAPQFRLAKKKAELEHQAFLKQRGSHLAKWMWVLFWLFIPTNIAAVIGQVPGLEPVGTVLEGACMVIYGLVLVKMSSEEGGYRMAGALTLVMAAVDLLGGRVPYEMLSTLLSMASAVLAVVGCYYEFNAHADVLAGVDNEQSEQWRNLWKWMVAATILLVVGLLFVAIVVGWLLVLAGAIAMLVLGILKLVYLYRTAQAFQDIAAS